jgi:hypothetical protein
MSRFLRRVARLHVLAFIIGVTLLGVAAAQELSVDQIIGDLCANQGAMLTWAVNGLAAIGGASLLVNLRSKLPPWLVAILDFAAANWWHLLSVKSAPAKPADAPPPAKT